MGYGVSHWWGLQVVELQVWPSGCRGLAQQQDGEQQQQQQTQDGCGHQWMLADSGGKAGEAEGGPRETGLIINMWLPTRFWRHPKSTPEPRGVLGPGPPDWHQLSHHRHEGLLHLWHILTAGRQAGC